MICITYCTVYACVKNCMYKVDSTVDHSNHTLSPSSGTVVDEGLPKQLLTFCQEIAEGMRYLSRRGFVHRDLAARNILLSKDLSCKVSALATTDYAYYKPRWWTNNCIQLEVTACRLLTLVCQRIGWDRVLRDPGGRCQWSGRHPRCVQLHSVYRANAFLYEKELNTSSHSL